MDTYQITNGFTASFSILPHVLAVYVAIAVCSKEPIFDFGKGLKVYVRSFFAACMGITAVVSLVHWCVKG